VDGNRWSDSGHCLLFTVHCLL